MAHVMVFAKESGARMVRRVRSEAGMKSVEMVYAAKAIGCAGACPCGGSAESSLFGKVA